MSAAASPSTGFVFTRRFLPLFATQFLGAFNDNFFRFAMATMILFTLDGASGVEGPVMVTLAAGAFMLPYFVFSATAGQLADRFDKGRLIRFVKLFEILCMAVAAAGFLMADAWLLMAALTLMGTQSAFFGPVKYGILPDHMRADELVQANAYIEAGTFLAILFGTIMGIQVMSLANGDATMAAIGVVALATAGLVASLFIPSTAPASPGLRVNPNIFTETGRIIAHAAERRDVFLSILGISWFWVVGFIFLSEMQTLTTEVVNGNENLSTVFMAVFSVGIAIGSLVCAKLLKGEISARYVPLGALGMALFSFDLFLACAAIAPSAEVVTVSGFLAHFAGWRVVVDLLMISIFGGLYIVPLYTIMQARADEAHRARTIAANNVLNAAFMVVGAGITAGLLHVGMSVTDIFLILALLNVLVAIHICRLLPEELLKLIATTLFRALFRVETRGFQNLKGLGDRAVYIVNHVSFLDAALLAAFLPGVPLFAIDTHMARRWWVRPFLRLVRAFPLDPTNPMAIKLLVREVQGGEHCVIFPEGRLTATGALMKVYDGPAMLADKAGATVVPIRIDGLQHSFFTRLKGKLRRRLFPKVTITVLPPRDDLFDDAGRGRDRRRAIGDRLYGVMTELMFESNNRDQTLFEALLDARDAHGRKTVVVDDIERPTMSYGRLVSASFALGRPLAGLSAKGEAVGVLLPNAAATAATFFALQAIGRVPAMLNFTAGPANMETACRCTNIRTIVTSRRFVARAKLGDLIAHLEGLARVIYLEDLRSGIGLMAKLWALAASRFARIAHARSGARPDDPAVILFTSGSEGVPKGVALSHRNILSNCRQLSARVDFGPADTVLNALPVFHSFGLTGGMILPVLAGAKTFLYPSPLHYRIVPEVAYVANATIMFGTDTFLSGYARVADPYDFYAMRYVFAGAEKLRDETRRVWMEKFGLRLLEGYGATECAPVIAVNTPMRYRAETVGQILPGIEHRLEPVPGIADGGRLHVRGPNVMLGYLRADAPGALQPPADGWYDTGDIVSIDDDGFVRILGRAKRFAKIAGEMVSLTAVEGLAAALWPDAMHAVVTLPDPRKGEQLVLLTTEPGAGREAFGAHARANGAAELMVPKHVLVVDALPVLGTGKTDYPAAQALAEGRLAELVVA